MTTAEQRAAMERANDEEDRDTFERETDKRLAAVADQVTTMIEQGVDVKLRSIAEVQAALQAPFADDLVQSRKQGGRDIRFVAWIHYQQRLDNVFGPKWDCFFVPVDGGLECTVMVRYPDGPEVSRSDVWIGKEQWHLMRSKAFRRACVGHGIGRYLYSDSDLEGEQESHDGMENKSPNGTTSSGTASNGRTASSAPPPDTTTGLKPSDEMLDRISKLGEEAYGKGEWFAGVNAQVAIWASTKAVGRSGTEKTAIGDLTKSECGAVIKSLENKIGEVGF